MEFEFNGQKKTAEKMYSSILKGLEGHPLKGLEGHPLKEYTRSKLGPIADLLKENDTCLPNKTIGELFCFARAFCGRKDFERVQFGHILVHILNDLQVGSSLIEDVMRTTSSYCGHSHHSNGFAVFFFRKYFDILIERDLEFDRVLHMFDVFFPVMPMPACHSACHAEEEASVAFPSLRKTILECICTGADVSTGTHVETIRCALSEMHCRYLVHCDSHIVRSLKRLSAYLEDSMDPSYFRIPPETETHIQSKKRKEKEVANDEGTIGFCAFVMYEFLNLRDKTGDDDAAMMEESAMRRRYFDIFFSLYDHLITGDGDGSLSSIHSFHENFLKNGTRLMSRTHIMLASSAPFAGRMRRVVCDATHGILLDDDEPGGGSEPMPHESDDRIVDVDDYMHKIERKIQGLRDERQRAKEMYPLP
jgi:hypothetical protein